MTGEALVLRNHKGALRAFSSTIKPLHPFPLSLSHQVYKLCDKPIFRLTLDGLEAAGGSAPPATTNVAPQQGLHPFWQPPAMHLSQHCLLSFLQLSPLHGLNYWQRFLQTLAAYALLRPGDHHLLPAPELCPNSFAHGFTAA